MELNALASFVISENSPLSTNLSFANEFPTPKQAAPLFNHFSAFWVVIPPVGINFNFGKGAMMDL